MKFSWGTFDCWKGCLHSYCIGPPDWKLSMSASSLDANTSFSSFAERARKHIKWAWPQSWGRMLAPVSYLLPAFQCTSVSRHHPSLTWSLWALCCSLPLSSEGDTCRGQKFGSASYLTAFILQQVLSTSLGPEPSHLDFSQLVEHIWCHNLLSR